MKHSAVILLLLLTISCDRSYTPKPTGYIRVHYPEKEYRAFEQAEPYSFEVPVYARVEESRTKNAEPWWYNVRFPEYDGTVHLSYKQVDRNIDQLIEESRSLVYKHTSQADGILEIPYLDTAGRKYGILYELKGNVASSVQFFMTDSTEHFLRGSLYFRTTPNRDSLNPIIAFVQEDIEHMIETLEWN